MVSHLRHTQTGSDEHTPIETMKQYIAVKYPDTRIYRPTSWTEPHSCFRCNHRIALSSEIIINNTCRCTRRTQCLFHTSSVAFPRLRTLYCGIQSHAHHRAARSFSQSESMHTSIYQLCDGPLGTSAQSNRDISPSIFSSLPVQSMPSFQPFELRSDPPNAIKCDASCIIATEPFLWRWSVRSPTAPERDRFTTSSTILVFSA